MSDTATANLALPYMAAAQAMKHVTHNEALTSLDTLVQLACLDKDLLAPPANPVEGVRYLIAGANPTGAWTGWAGRIVRYQDGRWLSFVAKPGWLVLVVDETEIYTYTAGAWIGFRTTITALQNLTRLGIGTTADADNPFAAKLNKALWTALTTAEGGSGDLRYTLNKQAPGSTLSFLFQTGFSARAEFGLIGNDDLTLRVSSDGSTFTTAVTVDDTNGRVTLPAGLEGTNVGATTAGSGRFTTLTATATATLSPANASVTIAPTGTGTVTINPATAGAINRMNIGATTPGTGAFTTLSGSGTATFTGVSGADRLLLNGTGSNWINYGTAGTAAPSTTTRSLGTKLVLFNAISAVSVDYAIGIESGALWSSVGTASNSFKWYAATTVVATLTGQGNFSTNWLGLGGATADTNNRLSINSPQALFNHAGAGMAVTLNKAAAANDASFTFQTGFSTRALFGLLADDNFTIKVSPDGSAFTTAVAIDRTTGALTVQPGGLLGGGRLKSVQKFTANGTWTRPAGIRRIVVEGVAGGGGGGGVTGLASSLAAAAGGGAGSYVCQTLDVTALPSAPVVVGNGGVAGANTGGNGGPGGTSSFNGTSASCAGGLGGAGQTAGTLPAISDGGNGGLAATTSAPKWGHGATGNQGLRLSASVGASGNGGPGPYGGGGLGRSTAGAGDTALSPGAGGGGALSTAATAFAGGAGAPGLMTVWEYE